MKDQLDQILTEFAELHNLTKEEVRVEPLPSMRTVPLPPLKYRAKHLKDDIVKPNRPDINNKRKKKKYKKKYKLKNVTYTMVDGTWIILHASN